MISDMLLTVRWIVDNIKQSSIVAKYCLQVRTYVCIWCCYCMHLSHERSVHNTPPIYNSWSLMTIKMQFSPYIISSHLYVYMNGNDKWNKIEITIVLIFSSSFLKITLFRVSRNVKPELFAKPIQTLSWSSSTVIRNDIANMITI